MNLPEDEDAQALSRMAADGIDMSRSRAIEFCVAAPDQQSAEQIGRRLIVEGYEAEVVFDEGEPNEDGVIDPKDEEFGSSWTIYVVVSVVPDHGRVVALQSKLAKLVDPLGGKLDGWGASC